MTIEIVCADYSDSRDAAAIALLMDAYARDPMGGGEPLADGIPGRISRELAKLPHAFTILCYVDDQPAGLINCFELFSTFACRPLINIHDVVVLIGHRGRGLSQRMLEKVEAIAIDRGCCKLTLEVLSGNEVAKSSYEKFGFAAYELDPEAGSAMFWQKRLADA